MADRPLSIDIRHPLLLKANDLVLLTGDDGNIAAEFPGFGLFFRDICYVGAYQLRLHGTKPLVLMASDTEGMAAQIEATNSKLSTANGAAIADHKLSLRRTLLLLEDGPSFVDTVTVHSFADGTVILPISLEFHTTFESMFALRGGLPRASAAPCRRRPGTRRPCASATRAPTVSGGRFWWTSLCRRSSPPHHGTGRRPFRAPFGAAGQPGPGGHLPGGRAAPRLGASSHRFAYVTALLPR